MNCVAKIIFSIVTIFVMLCTAICAGVSNVYASDDNSVKLRTILAEGEANSITMSVQITENAGFDSIQFEIEYDQDAVELTACKNEWSSGKDLNSKEITDYPYVCTWRNLAGSKSDTGRFLTLTFEIKDEAPAGEYQFNIVEAYSSSSIVIDGKPVKSIRNIIVENAIYQIGDRTDMTGEIISYDNADNAIIRLYPYNLSIREIKEDIFKAEHRYVLAEAVKADINELEPGKKYSQQYTLTAVAEGKYKLAVYKPGYGIHIENIRFGASFNTDITLCLLGDLNGDGIVGLGDKTLFARHLANWTGYDESIINKEAADINGDGNIKDNDAAILYRHLAKWRGDEKLEYGMNLE